MTNGHGDDIYNYSHIELNFSSNVYNHHDHSALMSYMASQMGRIMHYPEPVSTTLEQRLADDLKLSLSQVMATNGATEAIYLIAQATKCSNTAIMIPAFAEYADACRIHEHKIKALYSFDELTDGFDTVWLCNPSNPTGVVYEREMMLNVIRRYPNTLFIIDSSYAPFTLKPLIGVIEAVRLPNVLLLHSMTKEYAVPGLRLGYVTASASLINKLRMQQMPWSVNALAQLAGCWLIEHKEQYHVPVEMLMKERERVTQCLTATGMIDVGPSDTHMLLCKLHQGTAANLKDYLATKYAILIRDASNFEGLTSAHFRIAVQTPDENNTLLEAIIRYFGEL